MNMGIDPKIIAQLERAKQAPQDNGVDAELPGMPAATPNGAGALPMLRGTPKQIKWATTIRENALALEWVPAIRAMLVSVVDSTWWIANRAMVSTMKFKDPSPQQCAMAAPKVMNQEYYEAVGGTPAVRGIVQVAQEAINRKRLEDAFDWAHSVAQNPRLAEAAIVAVLSRLYKDPDMRQRLRRKGNELLEQGEADTAKDVDAIRRMLLNTE